MLLGHDRKSESSVLHINRHKRMRGKLASWPRKVERANMLCTKRSQDMKIQRVAHGRRDRV